MDSGSGRVKFETKRFVLLRIRRGGFSREYSVITPPKRLALFEMREMILKGRKPKSCLKDLASKCCMKQRNKGVQAIQLVLYIIVQNLL